jgi:hypothetical protein
VTGTAALELLLGAALVAIGVLAAALADRIRGHRPAREVTAPRASRPAAPAADPIRVVEPADLLPRPAAPKRRAESPKAQDGADEVIAALVAAGYKRPIATEAVWSCGPDDRASVEDWTRAALRRCARGGMS